MSMPIHFKVKRMEVRLTWREISEMRINAVFNCRKASRK